MVHLNSERFVSCSKLNILKIFWLFLKNGVTCSRSDGSFAKELAFCNAENEKSSVSFPSGYVRCYVFVT